MTALKKEIVKTEKNSDAALSPGSVPSGTEKRCLTVTGVVVKNAMHKTIVVAVVAKVPDPKYGRLIKKTTKYYAHDEHNEAKIGETVLIQHVRPLSKLKRWQLLKIMGAHA
jgi:small subunit ribosomal protein S17